VHLYVPGTGRLHVLKFSEERFLLVGCKRRGVVTAFSTVACSLSTGTVLVPVRVESTGRLLEVFGWWRLAGGWVIGGNHRYCRALIILYNPVRSAL
jgi:hypothetical protein